MTRTFANAIAQRRGALPNILSELTSGLAEASIEVVDLTQTLSSATPIIQLPPPYAPSAPVTISPISRYDAEGPVCYWNNLSFGEHTGTHFDAPIHWFTGKNHPEASTETLAPSRFIAPACVIDCSQEVADDDDFLLDTHHIETWEARHGLIPTGAWVLMRSDWSKRSDPTAFLNLRSDGPHSPGPSSDAVRFLLSRNINGWGVECVGTDAGQAFGFDPPFPAHHLLLGARKLGLASLKALDRLPPVGAMLIAAPLKIENGSGSPIRALALVPSRS